MAFGLLIAQEITCGVVIGAIARLIMSALQVAGYLIATQTGLAYAQTVDPTMGVQGAIVGTFFSLMGTVMIFATNMHHLAIGAIEGSYRMLPPGGAFPTGDLAELAIRYTSGAFLMGLQLAAPFVVFGFVVTASIGLLARLMPQLQVFFVAMPIDVPQFLRPADGGAALSTALYPSQEVHATPREKNWVARTSRTVTMCAKVSA
jgi:flagellar biosynthetic protein FliR